MRPWDGHGSSGPRETPPVARTGTLRPMWARLSIVAGLVVGVAVAGLLLGGILALTPDPPPPSTPAPSITVESASPSAIASPVASPSVVPSASAADAPYVMADGLKTILPGVDVTPVSLGDSP